MTTMCREGAVPHEQRVPEEAGIAPDRAARFRVRPGAASSRKTDLGI